MEILGEKIEPIKIKDKIEIPIVDSHLKKIGMSIFSSDEEKHKFMEKANNIKNVFLIYDSQPLERWRIQSHYIGEGISISEFIKFIERNSEKVNKINKWLDDNSYKGSLLSSGIERLIPDIGYVINVDDIEIPKDIFPEEYKEIRNILDKVLIKLEKYYNQKYK